MFDLSGVLVSWLQMGLTLCCHRRSVLEPLPEPEPVLSEAPSSPSSSESCEPEHSAEPRESETAAEPREPEAAAQHLALSASVPGLRLDLGRVEAIDWHDPEIRIYSVWVIPKARVPTLFAGIHSGRDLAAYAGILGLNQGAFEGIRWQRCRSHERAVEVYWREAGRFELDHRPLQYFRWQRLSR